MKKNSGFTPEDILPEEVDYNIVQGHKLRKGTVAATLKNLDVIEDSIVISIAKCII